MSLFSRLFGKAPPTVALPQKVIERLDAPSSGPGGPAGQPPALERAAVAAKEEEELKAAIAAHDTEAIARLNVLREGNRLSD